MSDHDATSIKEAVRDRYAGHAKTKTSCCGGGTSCCGSSASSAEVLADYNADDLSAIPADADLGLGCGNPLALESVQPGEVVVDLGSGGGIDCFVAAKRVGPEGRVIGVDMTPEMIALARRNARSSGMDNVEFRLGEIEALPVQDCTADLVISNCVINLVPDKSKAFAEALRVLKPGGRISVSDIVTTAPLPDAARSSVGAYVACLGGAMVLDEYLAAARDAGFEDVRVVSESAYATCEDEAEDLLAAFGTDAGVTHDEAIAAAQLFRSVTVHAVRPA
ncbi:MAG: arsenite S-adenosylmethyltransferase [Actinobacteria bacterium HGW-Actinobacteria-1]|jgi:SAM-dependent methyltransferase|nr:MAG: arsenite S-adenosylmethyltransferase [Actinobacteria bacterium HGW-Actinobacteria-1]